MHPTTQSTSYFERESKDLYLKKISDLSEEIDAKRIAEEKRCTSTNTGFYTKNALDAVEACKQSIFKVNNEIIKYSQRNPHINGLLILNVNFNLWKTYAGEGKLPEAIIACFDPIVANLGYRSVCNIALTSKITYQLIQNNECNKFRLNFFRSLQNFITNRKRAFSPVTQCLNPDEQAHKDSRVPPECYSMEYDRQLIFKDAAEQLSSYQKKLSLSKENSERIFQDWMSLQEIFSTSQKSALPLGNALFERDCKEHNLKMISELSMRIDAMRISEENRCTNTDDGLDTKNALDVVEICKQSIFQVNEIIRAYNQRNPRIRWLRLLNVNFNLWKTDSDNSFTGKLSGVFLEGKVEVVKKMRVIYAKDVIIFDLIVANLGYRALYNMAVTSKEACELIQRKAFNVHRMRFFCSLEKRITNRKRAFCPQTELLYRGEQVHKDSRLPPEYNVTHYTRGYDRGLIYQEAWQQLISYIQKAKLSKENSKRMYQDWWSLQEKV